MYSIIFWRPQRKERTFVLASVFNNPEKDLDWANFNYDGFWAAVFGEAGTQARSVEGRGRVNKKGEQAEAVATLETWDAHIWPGQREDRKDAGW